VSARTAASSKPPRRPKGADTDVESTPPKKIRADGLTYSRTAAMQHLRATSPEMDALIAAAGKFDVRPDQDLYPYPYLLRSIVFQQLNGVAAATIHGRVLDLFGGEVPPPEVLAEADVDALRSAGLSAAKAASIQDLARHAAAGELPTHDEVPTLSDLELVDRLTVVRGIGPWTVHMLLMFRLGRPDVLPAGDFGVQTGFRLTYGLRSLPDSKRILAHGECWRPYRTFAAWYLWRAADKAKLKA
jgi:DNA-3-methyladenine glycosylase II